MGKKPEAPEVFDFLYSLDYGICHGPIDHLNMVWVKDKSILCGTYNRRSDIDIHQPDLFGGDEAEGGVSGTLEFYPGGPQQVSSEQLSARAKRSAFRMPGYRGIAHLFFRGQPIEAEPIPEDTVIGNAFVARVVKFILTGIKRVSAAGWVWGTNNPYLPETKVNVTRLPGKNLDPYKTIWPLQAEFIDDANSEPWPTLTTFRNDDFFEGGFGTQIAPGQVIDLYSLGITEEQITSGTVIVGTEWYLKTTSWKRILASVEMQTIISFHVNPPSAWIDTSLGYVGDEAADADKFWYFPITATPTTVGLGLVEGEGTVTIPRLTVPAGTRYVHIRNRFDPNGAFPELNRGVFGYTTDGSTPDLSRDRGEIVEEAPQLISPVVIAQGGGSVNTGSRKMGTLVRLGSLTDGPYADLHATGRLYVKMRWKGRVTNTEPDFVDRTSANMSISIDQHTQEPENWFDFQTTANMPDETAFANLIGMGPGPWEIETDFITLADDATYVQFYAWFSNFLYTSVQFESPRWELVWLNYGPNWCLPNGELGTVPDANPANMIYECMTNGDWGKGEQESMMDIDSFTAAAATLFEEKMGISMLWMAQTAIETFIGEVLDHIQGFLFIDPVTGLWTLKLLRDDYNVETLRVLDPSNCRLENRSRRAWGETINEIVVSYTDPKTEKPATVSAHNLSNIAIQGGIVSDTRDYHGFRNPFIAQVVANRDVRAAGYPIFTARATVDRAEYIVRPGDLYRVNWPEDGIESVICRVMGVDYGAPGSREIVLDLSEDVFSIEQAQYVQPQTSEFENTDTAPQPLDAQFAFTSPAPFVTRRGIRPEELDAEYPSIPSVIFAAADGRKPTRIEVVSDSVLPNGEPTTGKVGAIDVTYNARMYEPIVEEAVSVLPAPMVEAILRTQPDGGELLMIGGSEMDSEIVMIDSFDPVENEWTIARGVWDTVPREWPVGTRVWNLTTIANALDPVRRSAGETGEYTLLPTNNLGTLDIEDATPIEATFTERPFAPFRPANVQIEGQGFGGFSSRGSSAPASIAVTWANRNRTAEDGLVMRWLEPSVSPETGQTTTLAIYDDIGNLHLTIPGLTGSSYNIPIESYPDTLKGSVEFLSVRDGYVSQWGARRDFDVRPPTGYGLGYGYGYGAN